MSGVGRELTSSQLSVVNMKPISLKKSLQWIAASAALFAYPLAHAQWAYNNAYWHDELWSAETTQSTWMQTVADQVPLLRMSIPGTHDSASVGYGGDIAQTQSMSITKQLVGGVRYLDFRCDLVDGGLQLHHGFVGLEKTCDSGLADVAAFLKKHPSEVVLIKIQQEYSTASNPDFQKAFDKMIAPLSGAIWQGYTLTSSPTLGDVRGKIVFIKRFNEVVPNGLTYSSFAVVDNYSMTTNWDLYSHWETVKSALSDVTQGKMPEATIINIVGSGGSFPYFVSGGRSSPHGGHLVTGLTTPGWSHSYPDFPRDSCFIGICSIYFKGLNELTAEYLEKNKPSHVGIIVADFPGKPLVDAIIERNARTWRYNDTASAGEVFVYQNPYLKTTDYFAARKSGAYWYFPTDHRDNGDWIFLGHDFPTQSTARSWVPDGYAQVGDLYEYRNPHSHTIDYFKSRRAGYYAQERLWFPINQKSNAYWEYVGSKVLN